MCLLLKLELNEVQIKKFKNLCSLVKQVVFKKYFFSLYLGGRGGEEHRLPLSRQRLPGTTLHVLYQYYYNQTLHSSPFFGISF
jgi:hypothetical protein